MEQDQEQYMIVRVSGWRLRLQRHNKTLALRQETEDVRVQRVGDALRRRKPLSRVYLDEVAQVLFGRNRTAPEVSTIYTTFEADSQGLILAAAQRRGLVPTPSTTSPDRPRP